MPLLCVLDTDVLQGVEDYTPTLKYFSFFWLSWVWKVYYFSSCFQSYFICLLVPHLGNDPLILGNTDFSTT